MKHVKQHYYAKLGHLPAQETDYLFITKPGRGAAVYENFVNGNGEGEVEEEDGHGEGEEVEEEDE